MNCKVNYVDIQSFQLIIENSKLNNTDLLYDEKENVDILLIDEKFYVVPFDIYTGTFSLPILEYENFECLEQDFDNFPVNDAGYVSYLEFVRDEFNDYTNNIHQFEEIVRRHNAQLLYAEDWISAYKKQFIEFSEIENIKQIINDTKKEESNDFELLNYVIATHFLFMIKIQEETDSKMTTYKRYGVYNPYYTLALNDKEKTIEFELLVSMTTNPINHKKVTKDNKSIFDLFIESNLSH